MYEVKFQIKVKGKTKNKTETLLFTRSNQRKRAGNAIRKRFPGCKIISVKELL